MLSNFSTMRNRVIVCAPLVVLAVLLGVLPNFIFFWMKDDVNRIIDQVTQLGM